MCKILKLLSFSLAIMLLHGTAIAQDQKEIDFKKTSDQVLQIISTNTLTGLNKYINPTYGMYWMYRIGVPDEYKQLKKLDSENPSALQDLVTPAELKKFSLKYGKLPAYICHGGKSGDESGWAKKGYIADSAKRYKPISLIAAFHIKYDELKLSKKDKDVMKFVEQNSRKIIFTGNKEGGIVFYLMYLDGKWWLSIIDRCTTDCEA